MMKMIIKMFSQVLNEEYTSHKLAADDFHYVVKAIRTVGIPFFWRWFGIEKTSVEYYGNCTVWHELPEMSRCPLWREGWLSEIYAKIKKQESEEKVHG
ncbi:MAG: hypothetical protein IMZ64_13195 [Bacteroidetes bacterium]|nr:hypothetical protein [Bacteroidota bacterium]